MHRIFWSRTNVAVRLAFRSIWISHFDFHFYCTISFFLFIPTLDFSMSPISYYFLCVPLFPLVLCSVTIFRQFYLASVFPIAIAIIMQYSMVYIDFFPRCCSLVAKSLSLSLFDARWFSVVFFPFFWCADVCCCDEPKWEKTKKKTNTKRKVEQNKTKANKMLATVQCIQWDEHISMKILIHFQVISLLLWHTKTSNLSI